MDFTEGHTPYDILGLANGQEATEADIKKAYRNLARLKHPDKNKNNPNAAAEFVELEKAYRILTDESARGALDDYLNAKVQRERRLGQQDEKRRKLREELEKREKEVAVGRNEEAVARSRLQQELERLRKQVEAEALATQQAAAVQRAAAEGAEAGKAAGDDEEAQQQLRCSLKVSWDPSSRDYHADELRRVFSAHGQVVDVVVRDKRSKSSSSKPGRSKASALVVMSSEVEAHRAAASVCGDLKEPLLVVPLLKVAPSAGVTEPAFPAPASTKSSPAFPTSAPLFPTTQHVKPAFPAPGAMLFPAGAAPGGTTASSFPGGAGGVQGPGSNASSFPAFGVSSGQAATTGGFSSFPGASQGGPTGFVSGMEDSILQKLRRAAEREKALAAAKAEEGDAG